MNNDSFPNINASLNKYYLVSRTNIPLCQYRNNTKCIPFMPRGTYKASPTFRSHMFQEDQCLLLALHGNYHMWWTLGLKIRTQIQYHKHVA